MPQNNTADDNAHITDSATVIDEVATAPHTKPFSLRTFFAHLHPLAVHFPIALLIVAALAEIFFRIRPSAIWVTGAVRFCLWITVPSALMSIATGWTNADVSGYGSSVELHRWLGISTAILSIICLVLCECCERIQLKRWWLLAALVISALVVSLTGHTGGELVHGSNYLW